MLNQPSLVRPADTAKPKPCPPMPASGFMNVNSATPGSNPKMVIAAYSVPTAMYPVRQFSKENTAVEGEKSVCMVESLYYRLTQKHQRHAAADSSG
jgi:hypothetical protein